MDTFGHLETRMSIENTPARNLSSSDSDINVISEKNNNIIDDKNNKQIDDNLNTCFDVDVESVQYEYYHSSVFRTSFIDYNHCVTPAKIRRRNWELTESILNCTAANFIDRSTESTEESPFIRNSVQNKILELSKRNVTNPHLNCITKEMDKDIAEKSRNLRKRNAKNYNIDENFERIFEKTDDADLHTGFKKDKLNEKNKTTLKSENLAVHPVDNNKCKIIKSTICKFKHSKNEPQVILNSDKSVVGVFTKLNESSEKSVDNSSGNQKKNSKRNSKSISDTKSDIENSVSTTKQKLSKDDISEKLSNELDHNKEINNEKQKNSKNSSSKSEKSNVLKKSENLNSMNLKSKTHSKKTDSASKHTSEKSQDSDRYKKSKDHRKPTKSSSESNENNLNSNSSTKTESQVTPKSTTNTSIKLGKRSRSEDSDNTHRNKKPKIDSDSTKSSSKSKLNESDNKNLKRISDDTKNSGISKVSSSKHSSSKSNKYKSKYSSDKTSKKQHLNDDSKPKSPRKMDEIKDNFKISSEDCTIKIMKDLRLIVKIDRSRIDPDVLQLKCDLTGGSEFFEGRSEHVILSKDINNTTLRNCNDNDYNKNEEPDSLIKDLIGLHNDDSSSVVENNKVTENTLRVEGNIMENDNNSINTENIDENCQSIEKVLAKNNDKDVTNISENVESNLQVTEIGSTNEQTNFKEIGSTNEQTNVKEIGNTYEQTNVKEIGSTNVQTNVTEIGSTNEQTNETIISSNSSENEIDNAIQKDKNENVVQPLLAEIENNTENCNIVVNNDKNIQTDSSELLQESNLNDKDVSSSEKFISASEAIKNIKKEIPYDAEEFARRVMKYTNAIDEIEIIDISMNDENDYKILQKIYDESTKLSQSQICEIINLDDDYDDDDKVVEEVIDDDIAIICSSTTPRSDGRNKKNSDTEEYEDPESKLFAELAEIYYECAVVVAAIKNAYNYVDSSPDSDIKIDRIHLIMGLPLVGEKLFKRAIKTLQQLADVLNLGVDYESLIKHVVQPICNILKKKHESVTEEKVYRFILQDVCDSTGRNNFIKALTCDPVALVSYAKHTKNSKKDKVSDVNVKPKLNDHHELKTNDSVKNYTLKKQLTSGQEVLGQQSINNSNQVQQVNIMPQPPIVHQTSENRITPSQETCQNHTVMNFGVPNQRTVNYGQPVETPLPACNVPRLPNHEVHDQINQLYNPPQGYPVGHRPGDVHPSQVIVPPTSLNNYHQLKPVPQPPTLPLTFQEQFSSLNQRHILTSGQVGLSQRHPGIVYTNGTAQNCVENQLHQSLQHVQHFQPNAHLPSTNLHNQVINPNIHLPRNLPVQNVVDPHQRSASVMNRNPQEICNESRQPIENGSKGTSYNRTFDSSKQIPSQHPNPVNTHLPMLPHQQYPNLYHQVNTQPVYIQNNNLSGSQSTAVSPNRRSVHQAALNASNLNPANYSDPQQKVVNNKSNTQLITNERQRQIARLLFEQRITNSNRSMPPPQQSSVNANARRLSSDTPSNGRRATNASVSPQQSLTDTEHHPHHDCGDRFREPNRSILKKPKEKVVSQQMLPNSVNVSSNTADNNPSTLQTMLVQQKNNQSKPESIQNTSANFHTNTSGRSIIQNPGATPIRYPTDLNLNHSSQNNKNKVVQMQHELQNNQPSSTIHHFPATACEQHSLPNRVPTVVPPSTFERPRILPTTQNSSPSNLTNQHVTVLDVSTINKQQSKKLNNYQPVVGKTNSKTSRTIFSEHVPNTSAIDLRDSNRTKNSPVNNVKDNNTRNSSTENNLRSNNINQSPGVNTREDRNIRFSSNTNINHHSYGSNRPDVEHSVEVGDTNQTRNSPAINGKDNNNVRSSSTVNNLRRDNSTNRTSANNQRSYESNLPEDENKKRSRSNDSNNNNDCKRPAYNNNDDDSYYNSKQKEDENDLFHCETCSKQALFMCSRCRATPYCGEECFVKDKENHLELCLKIREIYLNLKDT